MSCTKGPATQTFTQSAAMAHSIKDSGLEGAPFVVKTYQLVSDLSTNPLVGWSDTKDSFVVFKPVDFAAEVLPQYFKHNNFCSFIRQLNTYGFHKVDGKQWEFKHELFRENSPHLLKDILRRKSKKRGNEKEEDEIPHQQLPTVTTPKHQTPSSVPSQLTSPASSLTPTPPTQYVNLATVKSEPVAKAKKVDHEYEDKEEVEKLKDLNQLLMKEVVRLQQQQESTMDVINGILEQLMESKKEQHKLHKKVSILTQEVSGQLPGTSVTLITPPQSPLRIEGYDPQKSILSPPFFLNAAAPLTLNTVKQPDVQYVGTNTNAAQTPAQINHRSLETLLGDESALLGLDDLANLELTPNIEVELAKLLQNTLSPPQSPLHQPHYV